MGAHVIGSGTYPVFEGAAFARQGVILVTIVRLTI
jgi:para-nitrobenzyl esterase